MTPELGIVDCDMRSRGNRRSVPMGATVTRRDGCRLQVVRWEPGFRAYRAVALDGALTGREVLLFDAEIAREGTQPGRGERNDPEATQGREMTENSTEQQAEAVVANSNVEVKTNE